MTDAMANPHFPSASFGGGELWLDKPKRTAKGKALFVFLFAFTIITVITAFVWISAAFAAPTGGCGGG